jgi:hypothetical protein
MSVLDILARVGEHAYALVVLPLVAPIDDGVDPEGEEPCELPGRGHLFDQPDLIR